MYGIDVLLQEHENILRFGKTVRAACCQVLEGQKLPVDDFRMILDFGRRYADELHHKKEEDILFREMVAHLGTPAQKLVQHGMLVEHNLGRFHLQLLEQALNRYAQSGSTEDVLDAVVNIGSYVDLLVRHIDKENNVAYPFGARNLPADVLARVDSETEAFEKEMQEKGVQQSCLETLEKLEKKYAASL